MTEPEDRGSSPEHTHEEPPAWSAPPGRPSQGGPPPAAHPYGGPPPRPPGGGPPPPYGPGPYPPPYGQQGITSAEDPTWALSAYVGQLIIGIVAPLIVFFVRKDQSPFVRFHGVQGLNAALSYLGILLGGIALGLLAVVAKAPVALVVVIPAYIIFAFVHFVFLIIAAVRAGRREMYRLPAWICWRMVK